MAMIVDVTQTVALSLVLLGLLVAGEKQPKTPVFADNYAVEGVLSLPYAELNEPFSAYYDKKSGRSRTDYYGDLYQIYQFGPGSAPEEADEQYGALYKLVYVPASFLEKPPVKTTNQTLLSRVEQALAKHLPARKQQTTGAGKSQTRRACFANKGSVGFTVGPQTVLPNLSEFSYDSTSRCPHLNEEHRHARCELWKFTNQVGDKKNTYKMWIKRDEQSGAAIPVHYYMLGYDSLLGSHYDRYDVTYRRYRLGGAHDADFHLDTEVCGSMPGPGEAGSSLRAELVVANPIHEYVSEPHRYDHIDDQFEQFKKQHERQFESQKHERRGWHNFLHNFRFINGKNRQLKEYKLAVNRFADSSLAELRYLRGKLRSTGYNGGLDYAQHHQHLKGADGRLKVELPDSFDWTIRGAVTPVKDQAVCGSCWSFGTSGTVEGAYFVKTGKLARLSQQQMVDCSWKFGNNGCDGGEDFRAYQYIMEAGGLATEEDYGHYLGVDGRCHDNDVPKTAKISGFYNVTAGDVEALKHAIVTYGPVSISIDASQPTFTFYSHGVYYDEKCNDSPDGLDHSVLAVGYTKLDGKFVWMVKNSWSTNWGNDGYILMSAENNNCGVLDAPTVPIINV